MEKPVCLRRLLLRFKNHLLGNNLALQTPKPLQTNDVSSRIVVKEYEQLYITLTRSYKKNKMGTQYVKTKLAVVDLSSETQNHLFDLDDLISKLTAPPGKTSFLVFRNNKYITVRTENIAYFYVKYDSAILVSFDGQEYVLKYSLDHIQNLLTQKQFFRLNRQYLINFQAVKEVEYFFARKLLVNLTIDIDGKLLVPREKVSSFLEWLENR